MEPDFIPFSSEDSYFPTKRKRMSKEEAIYGIFGEGSEDSDAEVHKPLSFTKSREDHYDEPSFNSQVPSEEIHEEALHKTYGLGFKLLQKSGYKVGQGLGKNNQGKATFVDLKYRKRNQGLSYSGQEILPEEVTPYFRTPTPSWIKHAEPKAKRKKESIQSVQSQIRSMLSQGTTKVSEIIDMRTGEDGKVLKDLSNIAQNHWVRITGALEDCKTDVISLERNLISKNDMLVSLEYEEKMLKSSTGDMDLGIGQIIQIIEYLEGIISSDLDLLEMLSIFQTLETDFSTIFTELNMKERYAIPIAKQMFDKEWKHWNIHHDSLKNLRTLKEWKEWVGDSSDQFMTNFELSLQRYLQSKWKPKEETGEFIDILELWRNAIPQSAWKRCENMIFTEISRVFEMWDPRTDTMPVHLWIHPWLPLVDLSSLWPELARKLKIALQDWHPEDPSAKIVLEPWKDVLGNEWEKIMVRSILPKLVYVLREMPLNPRAQDLEPLSWVMEWQDLIPRKHFEAALRKELLERVKDVIGKYLIESEDNLDSAIEWYSQIQKLIPKHILNLEQAFQ
jgi:tuftelin-interacting protein 11